MNLLGMTYTQVTWVLFGIGLLVVEFIAIAKGDPPLTDAMRRGALRWMLWPALFGMLSGHFFGSAGAPRWGVFILFSLMGGVLVRDLFFPERVPQWTHLEIFLIFVGLGAWLWGAREAGM